MTDQKTTLWGNGLLWFGAAISIAEMMTGALLAPLGFGKAFLAIIIGHTVGCLLLLLAGKIGADTGKTAMETVALSFGKKGSLLFTVMNILQLLGWTAVMIISGAKAMSVISTSLFGFENNGLWCLVIGVMIAIWLGLGIKKMEKLNSIAVGALFLFTIVLSVVVFSGQSPLPVTGEMSFGMAVELSVAMPLSWLPLISDYTHKAENPRLANKVSVLAYMIASCWMYVIGLGGAIYAGNSDVVTLLLNVGMGAVAMVIVLLSTVTTTYLDVYSACISFENITKKVKEKTLALIMCGIGTLIAILTPIEMYLDFLYLIGSVFAPMVAILLTDYFVLKLPVGKKEVNWQNLMVWVVGFVLYRMFMTWDTPLGSTVPVMCCIGMLNVCIYGGKKYVSRNA